ncbi:MAG: hypothetical protein ACKO3W_08335 [bacterium]
MKNKGISYFEQHVEKFVLGAVGVVFFSVLVWQLIPSTVKVDGKDVALGDLDREIASKTDMLKRKLESEGTPLSEQLKGKLPPRLDGEGFAAKSRERALPAGDFPQIEPRLASKIQPPDVLESRTYNVPQFAGATMGKPVQVDDTLDSSFVQANPKAKDFVAVDAGSLDVSWLVPSAVLDAKAMFAALRGGTDQSRIPANWHRDTLFLVDVEFERQEVLGDGSAGATSVVEVLPGAFSLRSEIQKDPDTGLRDGVWDSLSNPSNQRSILQPEFVPTKRGNFNAAAMLSDPSEMDAVEDPRIRSLRKSVAKQSLEVARLEEELKGLGGPLEDTSKDDKKREDEEKDNERGSGGNRGGSGNSGQNRPGGGLGGGGLSGGMGGGKNNGGADPRDEATKEKRIKLTKSLKAKRSRLEQDQKDLEKLGATVEATKAAGPFDPKAEDRLVIWAHDLGVAAGKTYRYRAVVKTYNPFFTYMGVLEDSQKDLAKPFTMSTPISGWSESITVQPRVAFFVTDAVPAEGRLGVGQASVEIYTYRDGERRMERVTLQPGDAITSASADAQGVTSYFIVDVVADPTIERGGTDRRPSAIVVIQSSDKKRYELRVPATEMRDDRRLNLQDEVELARAEREGAKQAAEAGSTGTTDAPAAPPRGPAGR